MTQLVRSTEGLKDTLSTESNARCGSLTSPMAMTATPWLRTGAGILMARLVSGVTLVMTRLDGSYVVSEDALTVTQVTTILL